MKTIGILACRMLQDEIIYLIQTDPAVRSVVLVDNGEQNDIAAKMDEQKISYTTVPLDALDDRNDPDPADASGIRLVVWQLELALHEVPKTLKQKVYESVEAFSKKVNGILLFYGLCGNVLGKIEEDCSTPDCPVLILRDPDNIVVDDCIGATIGGRTNYINLLKSFKGVGTFIFTPMYAATTDEFFDYSRTKTGMTDEQIYEMNKFMFDACGYKYVAKLETGLHYTKNVDENIRRFADKYDFEVIPLDGGSQTLFADNYERLKKRIGAI